MIIAFYSVGAGRVVTQAGHLGVSGLSTTVCGICVAVREAMNNPPSFRAFAASPLWSSTHIETVTPSVDVPTTRYMGAARGGGAGAGGMRLAR
jgi:hypothetical protein